MSEPNLRELLGQLHQALGSGASVDGESRQLLVTVLRDIESALGKDAAGAQGLAERLEALTVRFEAGHPALGLALRQLIDALGNAGI